MKKIIGATLFVVYSIIAIFVTVLLLSFNEYNISEIGEYTIYIANNDALEPEYDEGSILIIKNTNDKHVNVGDELFVYKVISSTEYEVINSKLVQKAQQGRHILYTLENGETYDGEYFIGKAADTSVIEGPWGNILSVLQSKWGYLFFIVIVSLLLFLQEVFNLIIELKYGHLSKKSTKSGAKNGNGTKKAGTTATKKVGTPVKKVPTAPKKPATTVAKPAATPAENNDSQVGE